MTYKFEDNLEYVYSDEGQKEMLEVLRYARSILNMSGVITFGSIVSKVCHHDTWKTMACIDQLIRLGELKEIHCKEPSAQDRILALAWGE